MPLVAIVSRSGSHFKSHQYYRMRVKVRFNEGWLSNASFSHALPVIVSPTLDPIVLDTLTPCDYEGYITLSSNKTGYVVKLKLTVLPAPSNSPPPSVTRVMSQIRIFEGGSNTMAAPNRETGFDRGRAGLVCSAGWISDDFVSAGIACALLEGGFATG